MTYEVRRDAYLAHVKTCRGCVSSFTGKPKCELSSTSNGVYVERYKTISRICEEARRLLDAIA